MTLDEFLIAVIILASETPRPFLKPAQTLALLVYDPALEDEDAEQFRRASQTFYQAGEQFLRIAAALERKAGEGQ